MKMIIALALALALVLGLTACSGGSKPAPTEAPNTAPSIAGVADQTVEAGSEFDAIGRHIDLMVGYGMMTRPAVVVLTTDCENNSVRALCGAGWSQAF